MPVPAWTSRWDGVVDGLGDGLGHRDLARPLHAADGGDGGVQELGE